MMPTHANAPAALSGATGSPEAPAPRSAAPTPGAGTARDTSSAVVACIVGMAIASAVCWIAVLRGIEPISAPHHVPVWLFVAMFALSEIFVIHLHVKRETHTLSLNEIPLVLGLFFLDPFTLLAAHVLGSTAALTLHRRQRGIKLGFNVALKVFDVSVGLTLFHRLLDGAAPESPRAWLAAGGATIVIDVVAALLVSFVIWVYQGVFDSRTTMWVVASGALFAVANASLGLIAVEVIWHDARASVLFSSIAVVLLLSYRSYAALHDRYRALEVLQQFTRVVGGSLTTDGVAFAALREARELLRADRAELFLYQGDGHAVRIMLDGDTPGERSDWDLTPDDLLWARVVANGDALLLARNGRNARDARLRARLDEDGIRDLLAAPLQVDQRIVGMLLVANRLGDVATFDAEDLKLFETIANHASLSLENGRLVDALRLQAAEREYQALHDPLTGLPNRQLFSERVAEAIAECADTGGFAAVLLLDLDRFKEVNDTLGHPSGDRLLQEVAARLSASVRDTDTVARLGGDEFGVLLPGIEQLEHANSRAEHLRRAIARPYGIGGLTVEVDGSFGIAVYPEHGDDPATLIQRADVAMYGAKHTHSACQLYSPGRDPNSAERLALAAELREAIANGQLDVHFQPRVDVVSNQLVGAEALVRWRHPTRGLLTPEQFIPIAERTGLVRPLTQHVLTVALRRRGRWADAGHDLRISVNVSMRDLVDPNLPAKVDEILATERTPPSQLTLEVTESQLMSDPERVAATLTALHDLGVHIAIDDYGTGFSSLASLRSLPVDEIKIDKSFVFGMNDDENDDAIVRSTIELGRSLGLLVVAEGVENEDTVQRLRSYGCHEMQGFYLSRALAGAAFDSWMQGHRTPDRASVVQLPRRAGESA